jgi:protein SCO1
MSACSSRAWGSLWAVVAGLIAGALSLPGAAASDVADPHAAHQHAAEEAAQGGSRASRSMANYTLPNLQLVRDDGRHVVLANELNDGRPVVLNFIYTTCSGICPLASHVFSELQHRLGTGADRVHLVSISIDPEEDTPSRLRAYAHQYSAGPGWQHYTGTVAASVAAQRAFNVYKGDKMGHTPVTFVRLAPGDPWVRFDGFATADTLLQELHDNRPVTAAAAATRQ